MFAGNAGYMHDFSTYKNLISEVTVNNNGQLEHRFAKGESTGNYPCTMNENTVYDHKNLITLFENNCCVYSYNGKKT